MRTIIQLFVSKISASGDLQVPSSAQPMPLQVDGSIHVTDPAIQIHSLIITAKIQPMRHNEVCKVYFFVLVIFNYYCYFKNKSI